MKTPVRFAWIPSLILALNVATETPAQTQSSAISPSVPAKTDSTATDKSSVQQEPANPAFTISIGDNSDLPAARKLPAVRLSPWAAEIAKLAEAGMEDEIIYPFIDNSGTFNLGADQIIHLNQLGVSSGVITAMLQHDTELISGARLMTASSSPPLDPVLETYLAGLHKTPTKLDPPTASPTLEVPAQSPQAASPDTAPAPPADSASDWQWTEMELLNSPSLFEEKSETKTLYRLREPQPVELTSPIVLIKAEPRPANTVILIGFPRSEK